MNNPNTPIQQDPIFIANLKEYLSLGKKINDFKEALKKLEQRKKFLYSQIHHKMIEKKVDTLKLPDGSKLKNYVRKMKEGLTKKFIQSRLELYCQEKHIDYEEITDFIYNPKYRKVTEKNAIKKENPKKEKKEK